MHSRPFFQFYGEESQNHQIMRSLWNEAEKTKKKKNMTEEIISSRRANDIIVGYYNLTYLLINQDNLDEFYNIEFIPFFQTSLFKTSFDVRLDFEKLE